MLQNSSGKVYFAERSNDLHHNREWKLVFKVSMLVWFDSAHHKSKLETRQSRLVFAEPRASINESRYPAKGGTNDKPKPWFRRFYLLL
jgi:hypothetical protein